MPAAMSIKATSNTLPSTPSTQGVQKVHSKLQMRASGDAGGKGGNASFTGNVGRAHVDGDKGGNGGDATYAVPQGQYFVMGDNRPESSDSRIWGTLPRSDIVGRAFFMRIPSLRASWLGIRCAASVHTLTSVSDPGRPLVTAALRAHLRELGLDFGHDAKLAHRPSSCKPVRRQRSASTLRRPSSC